MKIRTSRGVDYGDGDGQIIDAPKAYVAGVRVVGLRKMVVYWDSGHKAWVMRPDRAYERDAPIWRAVGATIQSYYMPSFVAGAPTPAEQFAAFKAAPGEVVRGVDLPPCLDVEWGSGGFESLNQTRAAVIALILEHVALIKNEYGCCTIYTSQNEWYDLGFATMPELSDCALWVKTAYPVGAGRPPFQGGWVDPHDGDEHWDSAGYYQCPRPWAKTGWTIQQVQGDAIGVPGLSGTTDLNRFRVLALGDVGPEVTELQTLLGVRADFAHGEFDAATDALVRAEQTARGLESDGVVGPKTVASLRWRPVAVA